MGLDISLYCYTQSVWHARPIQGFNLPIPTNPANQTRPSEDSPPPRASSLDNRNSNALEFSHVKAVISNLTEEKNSAIRLNNKLCQELELLRREGNKRRGGFSFLYVMLIGLLGFLFGYLLRT